MRALGGLKVVDFSNVRTGSQASQVLADFGANVIHVEPPGGSPLRDETAWPLWARGKRSIALNLKDSNDRTVALSLCADADVVIETFRPGVADRLGLGWRHLSAINPRLAYCSITGFGSSGPLKDLQGYEGVVMAKFGWFWAMADMVQGGGRPAFLTTSYACYPTSMIAIQGIMAALYERESSGVGQKVEASLAQGQTVYDTMNWFCRIMAQKYEGGFRQTARIEDGVPVGGLFFRLLIAMTKDGQWLQFSQTVDKLFRAMMTMFELDWMFEDPKWAGLPDLDTHELRREFWEILLNKVRSKTATEWSAMIAEHPNVWAEPFRKGSELLDHPQMTHNGMVAELDDPRLGHIRMPGPIAHMSATPATVLRLAPGFGEHDANLRAEAARSPAPAPQPQEGAADPAHAPPLQGVTVVELGTYYAGPYAATLLSELGARVIKLEELTGDPHRNMLPFPELAGIKVLQGKECVAVDLGSEAGRAVAYDIIKQADVVLQSFRAGVAKRLKVDEASLRAINPDLIYHSAPGYGDSGPCGNRPAFAPTIAAAGGTVARNGADLIPNDPGLSLQEIKEASIRLSSASVGGGNPDGLSAATAATAIMIALYARKRGTAGGQYLLTTMLSSTANALAEVMLDYENMPSASCADPDMYGFNALYRIYETPDNWLFLAVCSDRDWSRLTDALDDDGTRLGADTRFSDAAARAQNDSALAEALAAIFRRRTADEWENHMVERGVACVACAPAPIEQHYLDPGSPGRQQGFVVDGSYHPMLDEIPRLRSLISFSRSETCAGAAGLVGQHTRQVLRDHGYDEQRIEALAMERAIIML